MPEDLFARPSTGQHGLAGFRLGDLQKAGLGGLYHSHQFVTQLFHRSSNHYSGGLQVADAPKPALWRGGGGAPLFFFTFFGQRRRTFLITGLFADGIGRPPALYSEKGGNKQRGS